MSADNPPPIDSQLDFGGESTGSHPQQLEQAAAQQAGPGGQDLSAVGSSPEATGAELQ